LSEDVFADLFGHARVQADGSQVVDRNVRQERQHASERGERIANQGQTQVVSVRPSLVVGNQLDQDGGEFIPLQTLEYMAFGKIGIAQGGADKLSVRRYPLERTRLP